jgi:hypothetical protein
MSYKIISTRVDNDTLWTTVEYTYKDATKATVEVAHFMPTDKAAVTLGIENREISEQRKVDAKATNETIKTAIEADIEAAKTE